MLPSFARESVIRLRAGTITERGSEIPDWSNPAQAIIDGCLVQPASTTLTQDGRIEGISEGLTVYFPPGTDVASGDRIAYDGQVYIIAGEIKKWKSPSGAVSNLQASLERWKG